MSLHSLQNHLISSMLATSPHRKSMHAAVDERLSIPPFTIPSTPHTWLAYSSTMFVFSLTYNPSKNFRMSLFRTRHACWMSAADCETFSRLLPVSSIWSLTFFDASTSTPGWQTMRRTIFSPRKFLQIASPVSTKSNQTVFTASLRFDAMLVLVSALLTESPPPTTRSPCSYPNSR